MKMRAPLLAAVCEVFKKETNNLVIKEKIKEELSALIFETVFCILYNNRLQNFFASDNSLYLDILHELNNLIDLFIPDFFTNLIIPKEYQKVAQENKWVISDFVTKLKKEKESKRFYRGKFFIY